MKILFLFLLGSSAAVADSVNVQVFRSPFNLNYGLLESAITDSLPWEQKDPEPRIFLSADYHYAQDPLVVINKTTNKRVNTLVDNIHTTEIGAGYFFSSDLSGYVQLPLHLSQMPGQGKYFDIGDTRAAIKWSLTDVGAPVAFAVVPEIVAPTGNINRYLSDDSLGLGALFVAETDFGGVRLSGNIGYRYARNARAFSINYSNRVPLGLGAAIKLSKRWILNAEITGALAFPLSQQQNPSEAYLGINFHPRRHLAAILGGSVGAFDQQGSINYRLQAAVRMYLGWEDKPVEPVKVEPAKSVVAVKPVPARIAPKARLVENRIEVLESINFEHDKATLLPESRLVLDDVADIIRRNSESIEFVRVEGHTSLVGSDAYNLRLSQRRANAVVKYLSEVRGISRRVLVPQGFGESRPRYLPGQATNAELELNRRVEFHIVRIKLKAR